MFFVTFLVFSLGIIGTVSTYGFLKLLFWKDTDHQMDKFIGFREATKTNFQNYCKIGLFLVNMIISTFFFPVLLLLIVQVKNLLINKTTYERIRGTNIEVKEQLKGKNKKGVSLSNCKAMCSNTRVSFMSDQSEESSML